MLKWSNPTVIRISSELGDPFGKEDRPEIGLNWVDLAFTSWCVCYYPEWICRGCTSEFPPILSGV